MFEHLDQLILALATLAAVFIMFLVISRTLNSIINVLIKYEYLLHTELDFKKEVCEVRKIMIADALYGKMTDPDVIKKSGMKK